MKFITVLCVLAILLLHGFTEASSVSPAANSLQNGYEGSQVLSHKINCGYECSRRCSKASKRKRCKRACKSCCHRCHCVPPGTFGNKELCPCYASLKTHGNKPKCP